MTQLPIILHKEKKQYGLRCLHSAVGTDHMVSASVRDGEREREQKKNWLQLLSCDREYTSIIIKIHIPQVPLKVVDRSENS